MWAAQSKNITINSLLSPPPPPPPTTSCTWALPLFIHFFMENCHIIVTKLNYLPPRQINKPPGGLRLVFSEDRVWVSGIIRSVQLENNILILLMKSENWVIGVASRRERTDNQSQSIGMCIVIGLSFCFCFRLQQSSFHILK